LIVFCLLFFLSQNILNIILNISQRKERRRVIKVGEFYFDVLFIGGRGRPSRRPSLDIVFWNLIGETPSSYLYCHAQVPVQVRSAVNIHSLACRGNTKNTGSHTSVGTITTYLGLRTNRFKVDSNSLILLYYYHRH